MKIGVSWTLKCMWTWNINFLTMNFGESSMQTGSVVWKILPCKLFKMAPSMEAVIFIFQSHEKIVTYLLHYHL